MRISSSHKLKNTAAWKNFSLWIRARDKWTCVTCGKKEKGQKMHAGHFIQGSGNLILFFDETNVHAQCDTCNRWNSGRLDIYSIFIRDKYGPNYDRELMKYARKDKHGGYSKEELAGISKKYRDKLKAASPQR